MMAALLIPVVLLVATAILLPRLLLRWMPETLGGLILNGAITAAVLTGIASGWLFLSYLWRDSRLLDLFGLAPGGTLLYFLRLGLMSALIWAPVLVLALATLPKRWKHATW
jgi:hypothetical protein